MAAVRHISPLSAFLKTGSQAQVVRVAPSSISIRFNLAVRCHPDCYVDERSVLILLTNRRITSRMLRRSQITLLVVSCLLASLATGQGIGSFTSPGPQISAGYYAVSLTFHYGDVQDFVWTVDLTGVRLSLWQQGNASGIDNPGTEDILDCKYACSDLHSHAKSTFKTIIPRRSLCGTEFHLRIWTKVRPSSYRSTMLLWL